MSWPATDSEAHAEWHLNAGKPIWTSPCPWDSCGLDDEPIESEGPIIRNPETTLFCRTHQSVVLGDGFNGCDSDGPGDCMMTPFSDLVAAVDDLVKTTPVLPKSIAALETVASWFGAF